MARARDIEDIAQLVKNDAHILLGANESSDLDSLMDAIGDARFVLIGEASHGTHEFYQTRAQLTRRLIVEKTFAAVVVEADWPDAYRVNRYVRNTADDPDADLALSGFRRFPQWMWRNREVLEFVDWLRDHNRSLGDDALHCGFYGMDLYSLYASIDAVLQYLDKADPDAARRARFRYGCFEQFEEDPQHYGYVAGFDLAKDCEREAIDQLLELQRHAAELAQRADGHVGVDEQFYAEQNARLVTNAERYYREMFAGRVNTWNLRDTHMVDTIDALAQHLDRTRGRQTKLVVWAHNSHLGDARHTQMGREGEVNVGQLCRQRWGGQVFSIGFTTHTGEVAAAANWGAPVQIVRVNPSLPESYEHVMHDTGLQAFSLIFGEAPEAAKALVDERLERAIGVIYAPRTERMSHYFLAGLPLQFDAIIHVDVTGAVQPLEPVAPFAPTEAKTFPTGV